MLVKMESAGSGGGSSNKIVITINGRPGTGYTFATALSQYSSNNAIQYNANGFLSSISTDIGTLSIENGTVTPQSFRINAVGGLTKSIKWSCNASSQNGSPNYQSGSEASGTTYFADVDSTFRSAGEYFVWQLVIEY